MKLPQTDGSKVHIPDSVVHFFQANVLLEKCVAGGDPTGVPSDPPVAADETDFEVWGVFDGRKSSGIGPRGWFV